MPIPMPYYLEKGPLFAVLESYINTGPDSRLVDALKKFRKGDPWESFEVLGSGSLKNPNQRDAADWVKHLHQHCFGKAPDGKGNWVQQPFHPVTNPQTGYWLGYYGDVDSIVRETFIRLLEVALGVDHDTNPNTPIVPTRRWPVVFLWKCSQSWFEGWVTWHRRGNGPKDGEVTVIWATPSVEGSIVLDSPLAGRNLAEYRVDPISTKTGPPWGGAAAVEATQGMWVVTHERNKPYAGSAVTTTAGSPKGQWPSPMPGRVCAEGRVVTVAPSMADGGVLAEGLAFTPPT